MKNTKLYLPIVLLLSGASMYASEAPKEEVTVAVVEPAKEVNWEKQDNKWVSTETDQVSTPLQLDKKLMSSIYVKEDITRKSLTLKDIGAKKAAILEEEEKTKKALEEQKADYARRITALKLAIDGQGVSIELNKKTIKQLQEDNEQREKSLETSSKELAERQEFLNLANNGEIKKEEPKKGWWPFGSSKPANQTPAPEAAKPVEAPKADTKTTAKTEAPTVKATTPVAVLKKAAPIKK